MVGVRISLWQMHEILHMRKKRNYQLPSVANFDFLHPIEADFDGLKADGLKVLNTLIYQ